MTLPETPGVTVSAGASPVKDSTRANESSHPVEPIVRELIDINSEIFELKEEIVSKGVPFNTINALVELARVGKPEELQSLRNTALKTAVSQFGVGAIAAQRLDSHTVKLVELEEDLAHVRKLAKGYQLEPQAVNLLTQIIRQNPGDGGTRVVGKLVEYARACGITVSAVELVSSSPVVEPTSVLPEIVIPEPPDSVFSRYRKLTLDIALGMLIAAVALSALT